MQRISLLFPFLILCLVSFMQAQTTAPKPDPELKKLHFLLGHGTYEGEAKATPLGPAGKFSGEQTTQEILGGFFLEARWTEKNPGGANRGLFVIGYDPASKNYTITAFANDGSVESDTSTLQGNTFTMTGKLSFGGKQYLTRVTETWTADWTSCTRKTELSTDGNTWSPWYESKFTLDKAAAKK